MYAPVLVTPPAERPISIEEAKEQLRVTDSDRNAYILSLIDAAVSHLDGYSGILGRCLVTQTWSQLADGWGIFRLPFPDVSAVAISYRDATGATVAVPSSSYRLVQWHPSLAVQFGSAWSAPSLHTDGYAPITITMTCGYGPASAVPWRIKQAIRLHVQAMHDDMAEDAWGPAYRGAIAPFRAARV